MKKHNALKLNEECGFTLIELLISIAILSIGILGIANMQLNAYKGNTSAGKVTRNANWSTDRAAEFARLPYDNPNLVAGTYNSGVVAQDADGIDNNYNGQIDEALETGRVSLEWTVTDDTPIENCKTIQITVSDGTGSFGKPITITYIKADII